MQRSVAAVAGLGVLLFCMGTAPGEPEPAAEGGGVVKKMHMIEWRLGIETKFENPYDPDEAAVDAIIRTPSGREVTAPAFYAEPCTKTSRAAATQMADITMLRIFLTADRWGSGSKATFFFDDFDIHDSRTGAKAVLDDFERDGEVRWTAHKDVAATLAAEPAHGGKRSLGVEFAEIDKEKDAWPGANTQPPLKDWSKFDTLTFWIYARSNKKMGQIGVEFYNAAKEKFQHMYTIGENEPIRFNQWNKVAWRFVPKQPADTWSVSGPGEWRLRYTPMEAGEHSMRISVKTRGRTTDSAPYRFTAAEAAADGFLRQSRGDRRYLAFDSGRPYFGNGFNLISRNTAEYDYYFAKMQKAGCNFVRVWLNQFGDDLESRTLGRYQQAAGAAIDHMLDSAHRHGIYVMMCILDFREASSRDAWKKNVYNAALGGPCRTAKDFYTSLAAKEFFKRRLRYLIARWGAYTAVHSWEFWNEVDLTDGWREDPKAVRAWHREMSAYLRKHDPFDHLITSSFAGVYSGDALWESRRMDIAQTHRYIDSEPQDFANLFPDFGRVFARYRKPYYIGEFGLHSHGLRMMDADGVSLHNGLWSGVMCGASATPMTWWWEWVDAHDLYGRFTALERFTRDTAWTAEGFGPLKNARLSFSGAPPTRDERVLLQPKSGGFSPAPHNRENAFTVDAQGNVDRPDRLARYIHGLKNHPDLHNPQIFNITYPEDGEFSFGIEGVSGYGGARLKVWLDSEIALEKDLPDEGANGATVHAYDGEYSIKAPKGPHHIKVENIGTDWYVLTWYKLFSVKTPVAVQLQGLQGDRTTLAWVWNTSHTWHNRIRGEQPVTANGVELDFWELRPGRYRITVFDTWAGEDIYNKTAEIKGEARLRLPPLERDVAVKLQRLD